MNKPSSAFVSAGSTSKEPVNNGIKLFFLGFEQEVLALKVRFDEGAISYTQNISYT
jgi:hypothetical protein